MAKRSSDRRVAYPEVKVQVRDLVRDVILLPPLPDGGQYSGKVCFIEKPGVPGAPSNGTPREKNPEYKTMEVAMWLNVVLTPGSLPRSQSPGTGPSTSCGYCCRLCPTGVSIRGKLVSSKNPE